MPRVQSNGNGGTVSVYGAAGTRECVRPSALILRGRGARLSQSGWAVKASAKGSEKLAIQAELFAGILGPGQPLGGLQHHLDAHSTLGRGGCYKGCQYQIGAGVPTVVLLAVAEVQA